MGSNESRSTVAFLDSTKELFLYALLSTANRRAGDKMVTTRSSSLAANGVNGMNGNTVEEKSTPRKRKSGQEREAVVKRTKLGHKTDISRWRMRDDGGRQTWHYLEDDDTVKQWPQSYADKWYLGLPLVRCPSPNDCSCDAWMAG